MNKYMFTTKEIAEFMFECNYKEDGLNTACKILNMFAEQQYYKRREEEDRKTAEMFMSLAKT